MIIIKDLGMVQQGKSKVPRRYYEVQCPKCGTLSTLRADTAKNKTQCSKCTYKEQSEKAIQKAIEILDSGIKQCSACKQHLPLEAFGKKTSLHTGFRPICKECRYEKEKDSVRAYAASVRGKLVSANSQGKRREAQQQTSDNSISIDSLQELKVKQDHKCYHCGCELDYITPKAVHLDHLIPISKGGQHVLANVVWSCQFCNLTKNNNINS